MKQWNGLHYHDTKLVADKYKGMFTMTSKIIIIYEVT